MTYRGTVQGGAVSLNQLVPLPDGTEVQVDIVPAREKPAAPLEPDGSLLDQLATVVGKAQGLPPDASAQHDHYLYGTPKRA